MGNFILPNVNETIQLKFSHYTISGACVLTDWYDGNGSIKMKDFIIKKDEVASEEELINKIKGNLNDNGFGSKNIIGAYVNIFASYSCDCNLFGTYDMYVKDIYVEKIDGKFDEDLKDYAYETYYGG